MAVLLKVLLITVLPILLDNASRDK